MERSHRGHVVGVPGGHEPREQEARPSMNEGEQVGHGAPTPRALPPGLAHVLVQFRCIGHRKPGPVDQERAVASPPPLVGGPLRAARCRPTPPRRPDAERHPGAGLTKRRGRQALGDQARPVATGGVAMQDVEDEQMNGGDGIEPARAPLVAHLATQGDHRGGVEQGSEFCVDVSEGFRHRAYHPGPPVCEMR